MPHKAKLYRSDGVHDVNSHLDAELCKPERKTYTKYKAPGVTMNAPLRQDDIGDYQEGLHLEGQPALFKCPTSACTEEFLTSRYLKNHITGGICRSRKRSQTQAGMMKVMYFR